MNIEDEVRTFITGDLGWAGSPGDLTSDYDLLENDVIDSIAIFQLVTFLEERFSIEVADEALVPDNFQSLGAINRLVASSEPST